MKVIRPRSIAQTLRLAAVAAGLLFTHALAPVQADPVTATERDVPSVSGGLCEVADASLRPSLGACEKALAACLNRGGDSEACWNAYWRCSNGVAVGVDD
jgi:hypothetical protein